MHLTLKRFCDHPEMGVFGELWLDNEFLAYTVEQPWNSNIPFQSCIPTGVYKLSEWSSEKYPNSMVLENPDLNVFQRKQPHNPFARYACLMHPANWARQLEGCIAFGDSLGFLENVLMVANSRVTTEKVLNLIREKRIDYIHIQWRLNNATLS